MKIILIVGEEEVDLVETIEVEEEAEVATSIPTEVVEMERELSPHKSHILTKNGIT